ncbi:NAD-dependent epimerase/dehydratase family protein [Streptosporangium sp. NPDC049046]|uniref:NAD-dependent epimerase/dehydratase family protein n=1 Tax=unclassified Streptosporangium TaxID=2632669 RepID=UPI003435A13E
MEIIGNGFLARHLRPISDAHPEMTILAAGVSLWKNSDSDYERETALVEETITKSLRQDRILVFFSTASMSMYGGPGCRGREDEPVEPVTPYGWHKLALERRIQDSGVRHLILRLGYVVGPHVPANRLIPSLIEQIRSDNLTMYRSARRDLIDITDWVRVIDMLLAERITQEVVNVATGESVPIKLIVDHLESRLGVTARRQIIDEGTSHHISVEKLRRLVPAVKEMDFGPDYHRTVIDRYLEATSQLRDGSPELRPTGSSRRPA